MHRQTDQVERPMRAGHGEKLALRLGSGGNVRADVSPAASTLRIHAAFAKGTFCTRSSRANRTHYLALLNEPNACKRCLAEIEKYRRRWGDLRPNA